MWWLLDNLRSMDGMFGLVEYPNPNIANTYLMECIRGILRDVQGVTRAMFATSVGVKDSNEAEIFAIAFALELSLQQEWMKQKVIIVESDSKNALAWINKKEECPWKLRFYCNKISSILLTLKMLVLYI